MLEHLVSPLLLLLLLQQSRLHLTMTKRMMADGDERQRAFGQRLLLTGRKTKFVCFPFSSILCPFLSVCLSFSVHFSLIISHLFPPLDYSLQSIPSSHLLSPIYSLLSHIIPSISSSHLFYPIYFLLSPILSHLFPTISYSRLFSLIYFLSPPIICQSISSSRLLSPIYFIFSSILCSSNLSLLFLSFPTDLSVIFSCYILLSSMFYFLIL